MRVEQINGKTFVVLSRRNLMALLAKLDGHPPDSACTIGGGTAGNALGYFVVAEEDDVHYADRVVPDGMTKWGPMHEDTEHALAKGEERE